MAKEKLYIVQTENGEEFEPANQDTLVAWAKAGQITPNCKIRTTLIAQWDKAVNVAFLKPILSEQLEKQIMAEHNTFWYRLKLQMNLQAEDATTSNTILRSRPEAYPVPSLIIRYLAGIIDAVIVLAGGAAIFALMAFLLKQEITTPSNTFYIGFALFYTWALLYFTLSIGLGTQTLAQRYWGIFLIKDDGRPFWLGRAFFYSALLIPFGFLTPLFYIFTGKARGLQDWATKTRMAKIVLVSKNKA